MVSSPNHGHPYAVLHVFVEGSYIPAINIKGKASRQDKRAPLI